MSKYKVGDRVRIVEDFCGHGFAVGSEIVIGYADEERYSTVRDGVPWYYEDNEIELVESPRSTEPDDIRLQYRIDIDNRAHRKNGSYLFTEDEMMSIVRDKIKEGRDIRVYKREKVSITFTV